jgi:lipopolysaccharide biosynthesis glycosyltransferase
MKNKVCFFSIADNKNLKYFKMMEASLKKFHPDIPLLLWDEVKIQTYKDPQFYYRATPIIAKELIKEYEIVIKIDSDSIVTDDLSEIWKNPEYDVAVVNNSNPREFKSYPYQFLNIHPYSYVNAGLVVLRSEAFINEWYDNCFSVLYNGFQMREQDFLNLLIHGNHYKVKRLDENDSFFGLASKGYWAEIQLKDDQLFLPKADEWPDKNKYIKVIHWAGGNTPDKMNFRIHFQPEVIKKLEELIKL